MEPSIHGNINTEILRNIYLYKISIIEFRIESGSKRISRSLLPGKRANGEHYYSLWIEDSPQLTAKSFN